MRLFELMVVETRLSPFLRSDSIDAWLQEEVD